MTSLLYLLLLALVAYLAPILPVMVMAVYLEVPEFRFERENFRTSLWLAVAWPLTTFITLCFIAQGVAEHDEPM